MKILLSWSSGKDSAWALHVLNQTHPGAVAALLTTVNEAVDRVAMHAVRRDVLEAQAEAAGLPLRIVPIPHPCSNDVYEARMRDAVAASVADGFTHAAFGDLFLEDVRAYRERMLAQTGLKPLFPIWGEDTRELSRWVVANGFRSTLTCVDPRTMPPQFVGRAYDAALLEELPEGVDPCGENGEFHTFVHDAPNFRHEIAVTVGETVEREGFWFADLMPVTDARS